MKARRFVAVLLWVMLLPCVVSGQDFKKSEAKISEYKKWLDQVGENGYRFWVKLDRTHHPWRLYVGEGFDRATDETKQQFVETFSRYLAGHPEKHRLIDLFDGLTGIPIGEYGWGGFKLYPSYRRLIKQRFITRQRQPLAHKGLAR